MSPALVVVLVASSLLLAFATGYLIAHERAAWLVAEADRDRDSLDLQCSGLARHANALGTLYSRADGMRRLTFDALLDLRELASGSPVTAEQIDALLDALEQANAR